MSEIEKVLVVGRGAVGGLFGSLIEEKVGNDFAFLVDEKRKQRYEASEYRINGVSRIFSYVTNRDAYPVDLVLITTKMKDFDAALTMIEPFLKEDTILISGLNGIVSDDLLMERYPKPVIRAISQKMDAKYEGDSLSYTKTGELVIGMEKSGQEESFAKLCAFFDRIDFPYVVSNDIIHDQYSKLMLNCAINQICAVYQCTYGKVCSHPLLYDLFYKTMKEVQHVFAAYEVAIDDQEINAWIETIQNLDPNSMPSMAQDRLARRKSEVMLFSGTLIPMAEKKGIETPFLSMLYEKILQYEKEERY